MNLSELSDNELLLLKKETENKISRYNNLQMALKIQVNSFYGGIGNQYSRWYNINYAEAVTVSGQMVLKSVEKRINEYLSELSGKNKDYIVAGDTDSIYLCLDNFCHDVDSCNEFCKNVIEPKLVSIFEDIADRTNAYVNFVSMKREIIASRGIFAGKKNYILNVWDSEGVRYEKAKIKMKGISAVKSSTPASCRKAIKDALDIIMNKENSDLIEFIENFEKEFKNLPYPEIAFPRTCNGLRKYYNADTIYGFKTPVHVRGALLYNKRLRDLKLGGKFPQIGTGDKIKYVYLKTPNPINEDVISFPTTLYPELGLDKYIDWNTQFEKAFINNITTITKLIDWQTKHINTLEDWFNE